MGQPFNVNMPDFSAARNLIYNLVGIVVIAPSRVKTRRVWNTEDNRPHELVRRISNPIDNVTKLFICSPEEAQTLLEKIFRQPQGGINFCGSTIDLNDLNLVWKHTDEGYIEFNFTGSGFPDLRERMQRYLRENGYARKEV